MDNKTAIDFFSNEIKQYEIMLRGSMNQSYREHIENKKEIFNLAVNVLSKEGDRYEQ